jgi:Zn-dependent protease with chaperone function
MNERPVSNGSNGRGVRPRTTQVAAQRDDGTRQLLQWGTSTLGTGLLALLLLQTLLGGFSPTGAKTDTGWFALIVALMCIPFGGLLSLLAMAKWLRNRALAKQR